MDQNLAIRTRDEIARISREATDSLTFRRRAVQALKRALPLDAIWFATADPTTLLFTGSFVEEIPGRLTPAFVTNEFLQDDVNKWTALARGRKPESLFRATNRRPEQSPRYRDILAPLGLGDELRVALTDGGACWGFMCLHREADPEGFRPDEIEFLDSVSRHLARGLRSSLLVENLAVSPESAVPGLLILADDMSLVASSEPVQAWLNQIADHPQRKELPQTIYALARRLQEIEHAEGGIAGMSPRVRIRTGSGRWLLLHAMRLVGASAGQIAIIIEPAASTEVASVVLQAYGLTPREAEIAQHVLKGTATSEIADALCISVLTVRQHLKAVFEKTGVGSRRELSARILYEQYVPRIMAGATPSSRGAFVE